MCRSRTGAGPRGRHACPQPRRPWLPRRRPRRLPSFAAPFGNPAWLRQPRTRRRPPTFDCPTSSCTIDPMSVPDRVEAARLLLRLQPPPWHLRHSRAVAETAAWLAARIAARAIPVDRRLVESAALLHDIDKLIP